MPLLHIRPHHLVRNGYEAKGERRSRSSTTDICIPGNSILGCNLDEWSGLAFHTFGVGFVPVCVFKEDAVTAAYSSSAIPKRIPRKTDARSRAEKIPGRAAYWNATYAALHETVVRVPNYLTG